MSYVEWFACILKCYRLCLPLVGDDALALKPPMYAAITSINVGATDGDVAMSAATEIPLDKTDPINRYF